MTTSPSSHQTSNLDNLNSSSQQTYPWLNEPISNIIETTTKQLFQVYTDKHVRLREAKNLHIKQIYQAYNILRNKIHSINDPKLKKKLSKEVSQAFDNEYGLIEQIYQMTQEQMIKTFDQKIQQRSPNPSMSLRDYLLKGESILTHLCNQKTLKKLQYEANTPEKENAQKARRKVKKLLMHFRKKYKNLIDHNDPFCMDEELRSQILNELIAKEKETNPSTLFLVDINKKITKYLIDEYWTPNI